MDTESSSSTTHGNSILYQAIKDNKMDDIKLLLDDGRSVNDPIITTGPYAGFTALHVACMEDNNNLVKLLVKDYKANVNVMAEDGIQPIHLACFYEPITYNYRKTILKIQILSEANANVDAKFGREIFSKYVEDKEWCPDFGNQMSLLIYSVIYGAENLAVELMRYGANADIKSLTTNKTLLMYAIDNDMCAAQCISRHIKDPEILNHRNNDGIPATHYLLHPERYGEFRYDENEQFDNEKKGIVLGGMIWSGVDLNALLNDDPDTFLVNMAAYRSCPSMLENLLPEYDSITHSKALYFATLPVDENSDKYMRFHSDVPGSRDRSRITLQEQRTQCIEVILKDLVNRRTFGLRVPDKEKKLMDELIATDTNIRNIVENYKRNVIEGIFKKRFIEFGDERMTKFDFLMEVYDDRKLKILMRNENFQDETWYRAYCVQGFHDDYDYFNSSVQRRIKYARKRLELLEKLKKIAQLREAIPLPYELILDIVDYLPNKDFESLINAFVTPFLFPLNYCLKFSINV